MKLLETLKLLKNNNIKPKDLNSLINYTISTAFSFLKIKKAHKCFNLSDDLQTLEDIASEAIVQLFVKNENGELGIIKSYNQWRKPLESEADAQFFINKIVSSRVEQTIPLKLKERDPFFGKILNTIAFITRKGDYKKISYLGTIFIVRSNQNEFVNLDIISAEDFDKLPIKLFLNKQKELIEGILCYLNENTQYFPAIPLNRLAKKIKYVMLSEYSTATSTPQHISSNLYVKEIYEDCLGQIKSTITNKYVKTKKLSHFEGDAIAKSFETIISDFQNGGMHSGLFSYIKEEIPELTNEEFYSKYHGIVNYLLKKIKKDLLEKWNY